MQAPFRAFWVVRIQERARPCRMVVGLAVDRLSGNVSSLVQVQVCYCEAAAAVQTAEHIPLRALAGSINAVTC